MERKKKEAMKIIASVNPFVPKAQTRWQLEAQPDIIELRNKVKFIEKDLRNVPRVSLESLDVRDARIQAALSIGDGSLGKVIRAAAAYGGYGGWRRAEKETGVQFFSLPNDPDRFLRGIPWSHLVD